MNKAIEDYLAGYTGGANTLQPSVTVIESGHTLALGKEFLKEIKTYKELEEGMFNMFDTLVENYGLYPDSLESEVMIFGFSTLEAHTLIQKWMKKKGI